MMTHPNSQPGSRSQDEGQKSGTKGTGQQRVGPQVKAANYSKTEDILFVPHTPGGILVSNIQRVEDSFAKVHNIARIKVIERGGRRIADSLSRKNPWAPDRCQKEDCMLCQSQMVDKADKGKPAACVCENVVYRISCDECALDKVSAHYYGESAQTGYLHGGEHAQGRAGMREDNALHKHDVLHHPGKLPTYSMKIVRTHKTALARQVHLASTIQLSEARILMNNRGEFNNQRIPRITIEVGASTVTEKGQRVQTPPAGSATRTPDPTHDNGPRDHMNPSDPQCPIKTSMQRPSPQTTGPEDRSGPADENLRDHDELVRLWEMEARARSKMGLTTSGKRQTIANIFVECSRRGKRIRRDPGDAEDDTQLGHVADQDGPGEVGHGGNDDNSVSDRVVDTGVEHKDENDEFADTTTDQEVTTDVDKSKDIDKAARVHVSPGGTGVKSEHRETTGSSGVKGELTETTGPKAREGPSSETTKDNAKAKTLPVFMSRDIRYHEDNSDRKKVACNPKMTSKDCKGSKGCSASRKRSTATPGARTQAGTSSQPPPPREGAVQTSRQMLI